MLTFRSRLLSALLAVLVAGAVLVGIPAPANAVIISSCTNTGCPDPTGWATARKSAHAGYPSNGGTINGANCTNYVAWRLMVTQGYSESALSGFGNARTWDTRAAAKGFKVDRTPAVGAVAQWDNNHVAYVEQINGDGTIVISESNVWVGTPSNRKWLAHRVVKVSAVDHFIHFGVIPVSASSIIVPGDFSGDGQADVMALRSDGVLMLYPGNGRGTFAPEGTQILTGMNAYLSLFAGGDFDGDGHVDVLAIDPAGALWMYRGDGAGAWIGSRVRVGTGTTWNAFKFVFSPGDFTGDGASDVLAVFTDGRVALFTGDGAGGWAGGSKTVATGFNTAKLVASAGDYDNDGKSDVLTIRPDGDVKVFRGNGAGGFTDPAGSIVAEGWTDVTAITGRGDLTGEGVTDVVALRAGARLSLYRGDGRGLPGSGIPISVTW